MSRRRRRRWARRLGRGGSIGAAFLLRAILTGAALAWFLDRHQGAGRRRRAVAWVRSLAERLSGLGASVEEASGMDVSRAAAPEPRGEAPAGRPRAAAAPRRRANPGARRAPPGPADRDDTLELDGDLREDASDETPPLRLRSPPVNEGLLGISWQTEGDLDREPADDLRDDEDRGRPDDDRHALREPGKRDGD